MNINRLSWIRGLLWVMKMDNEDMELYYDVLRAWYQFKDMGTTNERYTSLGLIAELRFKFPFQKLYHVIWDALYL